MKLHSGKNDSPTYGMYPVPPFSGKPAPTTPISDPSASGGQLSITSSPYITKDSGERQQFETGAQRDTQAGKPRYDLIPPGPLRRLAELYARGAEKYDDHNWTKGIPTSRMMSSALRHLEQFRAGERDEDHLAAVIFNVMGIMHFEGTEHDDQHNWSPS